MNAFRFLRASIGIALGVMTFGVVALGVLLLALVGKLGVVPRSWLDQAPRYGCAIVSLVPRHVLGIRVNVNVANVAPIMPGEQIVVIANHPSLVAVPLFAWCLGNMLNRKIAFVAKHEFRNNPFVGWPLRLLRAGIFIEREDRHAALKRLDRDVPNAFASGAAIMILPDQSRPTRAKIVRDRTKFMNEVPAIFAFTETLVPRIGGVRQVLANTDEPVRVIDVTAGFNRRDFGARDAVNLIGATYTFEAEDVAGGLPHDAHHLRLAVTERWVAKNERLRRLKVP